MNKSIEKTDSLTKKVGRPAKKAKIPGQDEGYTAFYNRYIEACHRRAVAPSAVAVAIGENNNAATRWKNGTMPTGDILLKLSEYLGVSTDYLLGNNIYDYTPQEREILDIFRVIPASQKHALLSVANKLKEEGACLNVSVGKKQIFTEN